MYRLDPTLDLFGHPLWSLLVAYIEKATAKSCARSVRLPQAVMVFRLEKGAVVGEPGFCLTPSTRPPSPGRVDIMGQAFGDLRDAHRWCLLVVVERESQPWLKGAQWREILQDAGMSPRKFEMILGDAWESLKGAAKRRGLLRRAA